MLGIHIIAITWESPEIMEIFFGLFKTIFLWNCEFILSCASLDNSSKKFFFSILGDLKAKRRNLLLTDISMILKNINMVYRFVFLSHVKSSIFESMMSTPILLKLYLMISCDFLCFRFSVNVCISDEMKTSGGLLCLFVGYFLVFVSVFGGETFVVLDSYMIG